MLCKSRNQRLQIKYFVCKKILTKSTKLNINIHKQVEIRTIQCTQVRERPTMHCKSGVHPGPCGGWGWGCCNVGGNTQ